jgi:hypothetical protein
MDRKKFFSKIGIGAAGFLIFNPLRIIPFGKKIFGRKNTGVTVKINSDAVKRNKRYENND